MTIRTESRKKLPLTAMIATIAGCAMALPASAQDRYDDHYETKQPLVCKSTPNRRMTSTSFCVGGPDQTGSMLRYRRPVDHSSSISQRIALTSRSTDASFGKSVATRVRRLISL